MMIVFIFRSCMANLPDTETESSLASGDDDDALDPRVQVRKFFLILFLTHRFHSD